MSKPSVIRSVGNDKEIYSAGSQADHEAIGRNEAETLTDLTAQARARIEAHVERVLEQSRADTEMELAEAAAACVSAEDLALGESEARLIAYREAEQAALDRAAAERVAAELIQSRAEADRNATLLQERANVLLRKAEQKAQQRLATETMSSKAAAFRLQTERDLAVLAEQRAEAELLLARKVELKLRAETGQLAATNERLADVQRLH